MTDALCASRRSTRQPRSPRIAPTGMLLVAALAVLVFPSISSAANALDSWREEVALARVLAENDAPLAYERARQLQVRLPSDAPAIDQARVLNVLARAALYLAQKDSAVEHALRAREVAREQASRDSEAEAELTLALAYVTQGRIDELIGASTRSMTLLDGVDRPDLVGEALLRMAMMYRRTGQVDESVNLCMRAMEIAQRSNNALALTYAHQGLAISASQSGRTEQAREHFQEMVRYARLTPSKLLEADALVGLAGARFELGEGDAAEVDLRNAIDLFRAAGAPHSLNTALFGLAHNLRLQGRPAEALPLLDEVASTYERFPNKLGLWWTMHERSAIHQEVGDLAAAEADARRAQEIAVEIGLSYHLTESARRLAAVAAATGDHRRAYELFVEATQLAARAEQEKISARMIELAQRFESEAKRREIEELTRRNQQQTEQLRQRTAEQRWLATVLLISVSALAGTAYLFVRLRRSHRTLETIHSQLRQSQAELQSQTGILKLILDSMGDGVAVANERGALLLANPAADKIVGVHHALGDAATWTHQYGFFLPDQTTPYPTADLPLARAIRGDVCDSVEIFVRNDARPDGRWLNVTARPLRDKTGATHGGVAVFSDVTARKQAEAEIRALNASLEQRVHERTAQLRAANKELEAFSYSVSHDLRTPLRSIDGFSCILLEDYGPRLDSDATDALRSIRAAARRMAQLIDDLLMLSRVSRAEVARSPVDLSALARAVIDDLRKASPERTVEAMVEPGLVAEADPRLVRIVLENLLGNAWKFTGRMAQARIELGRTDDRGGHVYFVRDNGVGFDPEFSAKLFLAFQRLHSASEFAGSGIGLATVQRIVDRHGGRVRAEGAPGKGATFFFTLHG